MVDRRKMMLVSQLFMLVTGTLLAWLTWVAEEFWLSEEQFGRFGAFAAEGYARRGAGR